MRREIKIAGFGGQGVGLAGYILGKALALYDGQEAVMTQSYGPEARGGASSANVVLADEPIDFPFVQRPDVLVALSQEAYDKFSQLVKPEGLIILDQELVSANSDERIIGIPCTRLAESLGRRIVANVVMLGFFTSVTGMVSANAMREAITSSVKSKTVPLNLSAFEAGHSYEPNKEPVGD